MKRLTLVLLILFLPMLSGCKAEQRPTSIWDRETVYSSNTSAEDCYLCGGGIENLLPSYWGQKNVALISLNTFEIIPLEINRYGKDGHLIEEYAGTISFGGGSTMNDGFSASMLLNYDRGFAGGDLNFRNDETLDIDKAASCLCADCLNGIIQSTDGPYFGVAVIDLETKKLRVLEKRLSGFGLGDYYIFCYLPEQENDDPLRMNLLIFYCPIRYGNSL